MLNLTDDQLLLVEVFLWGMVIGSVLTNVVWWALR